ncbi:arylsulfatase H-like [Mercenaria mercenaria]|uniref:arylsulfatase H-like n=1 Tax=Mercenaria mercenaria TaxID=6596 RepID=UPI00234E5A69|nr:arylsulfatase H-like [Mercenaria mercenaria]
MTQHLAAASLCTHSRSALLTGRYPIRTGMAAPIMMRVIAWASSSYGLPSPEITFAEQTKKAGYINGLFGKWHLGIHKQKLGDFEHHPLNQGFDYFYGPIHSNMGDCGGESRIITGQIPGWYVKLFSIWAVHTHTFLTTSKQFEGRSKFGRYGEALEELDWSVGQILKSVKEFGIDDNTLVHFTSDHGGHLEEGTDGGFNGILKGGKSHGASDGGIRVPGLIKWPRVIEKGKVTDEPTSLMDIYNLVSSVAGISLPADRHIDGRDILPLLKRDVLVSPQDFLYHYCGNILHAARYRPRDGIKTWKLVTREPDYIPGTTVCQFGCSCNTDVLATPKLYDITVDQGETTPIDSHSENYKEITPIILKAIGIHKNSIEPAETGFTLRKLAPNLSWQPCCNGTFAFNCYCTDPKYPE